MLGGALATSSIYIRCRQRHCKTCWQLHLISTISAVSTLTCSALSEREALIRDAASLLAGARGIMNYLIIYHACMPVRSSVLTLLPISYTLSPTIIYIFYHSQLSEREAVIRDAASLLAPNNFPPCCPWMRHNIAEDIMASTGEEGGGGGRKGGTGGKPLGGGCQWTEVGHTLNWIALSPPPPSPRARLPQQEGNKGVVRLGLFTLTITEVGYTLNWILITILVFGGIPGNLTTT